MPKWARIWIDAGKAWNDDNAFQHSAAVSFCTLFSLAPVMLIAVAIAGFFLGQQQATQQLTGQLTQLVGADSAKMIQSTMKASTSQHGNVVSTVIGIVLLMVGATTVFGQLQQSLNTLWGVKTKPSKSGIALLVIKRLISFAMVVVIGFLLLVSLIVTTVITAMVKSFDARFQMPKGVLQAIDLVTALAVITVMFALLFKVLPDVELRWREVWRSAFATSVLFGVGRFGIALYLGHSTVASVYGAAGSLVALLVWIYYSCAILFYGVEYLKTSHLADVHLIKPKKTAVVVKQEEVEV